jgi:hypothetical protein
MRNWLFGLPGRILYEEFPYFEENNEHALDFALHISRFVGLGAFGFSVYGSCSLPRTLG